MFLTHPIISKAGRVALVSPSEIDDQDVVYLWNDPATRRFQRFLPERVSNADIRAQRLAWAADPNVCAFNVHALKPTGKSEFVGVARIHHIDRYYGNSCEVGLTMSSMHFGAGLGRAAIHTVLEYVFEERKFRRVVFHTAVENHVIRGWLERLGATLEGIERDFYADGTSGYTDACVYSILDREWVGGCKARMEQGIFGASKSRL
ncbi:acyl-CoA N-acyltransferase [Mycena maculata]|uniref:Acyl-CoA N-acyltransferase n=1 Tax=Mycena maculata TaxID=230809 RepID=A0AAD7JHQ5_9AGAR|nr:acyl-CoA N-acyltransferase [Mycena maculata]